MSQEARFLEAREARTQRPNQQRQKSRHDDLHEFWTSLRRDLAAWQGRLDTLQQESCVKTASQRKACIEKLDILLQDLYALRSNCLSLSNAEVPELPPADVRLLHQEFTTMAGRLDQVREELIPPTKFTFKRYRAAMQRQQKDATNENEKTTKTTVSKLPVSGNIIQNHCDATMILHANGNLVIQGNNGEERIVEQTEKDSSSLLLQNLELCQVTINGYYKALHIRNVTDCSIRVVNPVDGALHVTACHELELFATCHQLRMHESRALKCRVTVGSGPILEDCTDILFYASSKNDMVHDAKDFNWLRNGVPSPNFCIVKEGQGTSE